MQGKILVIDGADGSGKATQTRLLYERLRQEGMRVEMLDFPRYEENMFGTLIRECLDGKHGDFMNISPKIASALYAADRFESRGRIQAWLDDGVVVLLDRYVSANMMHQGAKITDTTERDAFLSWLDTMEYEVFKLPRPHAIIYLEVPYKVRKRLVSQDTARSSMDIAEQDDMHQMATEACAKCITESNNAWYTVSCVSDDVLRSKDAIHEDVYTLARAILQE